MDVTTAEGQRAFMRSHRLLRRIQPWPWRVEFRQWNANGNASRPRLIDDKGKAVSLSKAKHATLMAMAPVLLDRLEKLVNRAEMLHMQIQSELATNLPMPKEIADAAELVKIAERLGDK